MNDVLAQGVWDTPESVCLPLSVYSSVHLGRGESRPGRTSEEADELTKNDLSQTLRWKMVPFITLVAFLMVTSFSHGILNQTILTSLH